MLLKFKPITLLALLSLTWGGAMPGARADIACDQRSFHDRLPPPPNGCHREKISASGDERPTTIWARRSVADAWKDQVITKFGERFARWDNAACAREECVPATLPGFTRCTFTGYACAERQYLDDAYEISRADVRDMQRLLNRYGYDVPVDGKFGGRTAEALERWQRSRRLTINPTPTRANLEMLRRGRA